MSKSPIFENNNYNNTLIIKNLLNRPNFHIIRVTKDPYNECKGGFGPIQFKDKRIKEKIVSNLEELTNLVIDYYEINRFKLQKIDSNYHPIVYGTSYKILNMEVNTLYFEKLNIGKNNAEQTSHITIGNHDTLLTGTIKKSNKIFC